MNVKDVSDTLLSVAFHLETLAAKADANGRLTLYEESKLAGLIMRLMWVVFRIKP